MLLSEFCYIIIFILQSKRYCCKRKSINLKDNYITSYIHTYIYIYNYVRGNKLLSNMKYVSFSDQMMIYSNVRIS